MPLREDLDNDVATILRSVWTTRDGNVVPADDSIKLSNDGVYLDATVLYADLNDSTSLVDGYSQEFAAEIYKSYLHCAAKIVTSEGGVITAFDGDRIMAVFANADNKNTSAVRCALKINFAREEIVIPALRKQYPLNGYTPTHVVGVDTCKLFVARTGIRGSNDLVWVGRAANHAAKLTSLSSEYPTYITKEVYDRIHESVRVSNGQSMWKLMTWNNQYVYGSRYWWRV